MKSSRVHPRLMQCHLYLKSGGRENNDCFYFLNMFFTLKNGKRGYHHRRLGSSITMNQVTRKCKQYLKLPDQNLCPVSPFGYSQPRKNIKQYARTPILHKYFGEENDI